MRKLSDLSAFLIKSNYMLRVAATTRQSRQASVSARPKTGKSNREHFGNLINCKLCNTKAQMN